MPHKLDIFHRRRKRSFEQLVSSILQNFLLTRRKPPTAPQTATAAADSSPTYTRPTLEIRSESDRTDRCDSGEKTSPDFFFFAIKSKSCSISGRHERDLTDQSLGMNSCSVGDKTTMALIKSQSTGSCLHLHTTAPQHTAAESHEPFVLQLYGRHTHGGWGG